MAVLIVYLKMNEKVENSGQTLLVEDLQHKVEGYMEYGSSYV